MQKGRIAFKEDTNTFKIILILISFFAALYLISTVINQPDSLSYIKESEGWARIGKKIFISSTEEDINMGLVISGKSAALIDTGYRNNPQTERVKKFIDDNGLKVEYIFITHKHADHTGGLSLFVKDGVKIVDSSNTMDGDIFVMGDKEFRVFDTAGHMGEDMHISVELVKENILFAGDVIETNGPVGIGGSLDDLKRAVRLIDSKSYNWIIPGHGPVVDSKTAVSRQLEYMENLENKVKAKIKSNSKGVDLYNIPIEECVSDMTYITSPSFRQVHMLNIKSVYAQLKNAK